MNILIKTWQKTIEWILTANECIYESNKQKYTVSKKSNDIRELAAKQLGMLDDTRPNKEKSLYSQCNEEQKEFINYLEQVILWGNVEGKQNYDTTECN